MADWQTAPIDGKLRAMLGFLDTMVRQPDALGPADAARVFEAGVSPAAVRDAAYVCALFCTITRLADALDWDVPSDFASSRRSLVRFGYRMPPLL